MQKNKSNKTLFLCSQCGYESRKWMGRCPDCDTWDSLVETQVKSNTETSGAEITVEHLAGLVGEEPGRISSGIAEMDRVLGGGIVPGSLILIGGDPGIGKSTLILQMLASFSSQTEKVLYITGEESTHQIRLRASRLAVSGEQVYLSTENCVEAIIDLARTVQPALLAVDSIQTVYSKELSSAPGTVSQVRESAACLLALAKETNLPTLLVGHVTKDGSIAGPRVLEHMVDTVLYFEGDRGHMLRILRTVKNRFGSTNEIGVFEMKEHGLAPVDNPSALFLAERPINVPGSVVFPSMEGARPVLVEVQALVSRSSVGTGRRTAIGADPQRLALLTAVLEKKLGITLFDQDIFLNIAGGIRIDEPALDLAVAAALLSSFFERPIDAQTIASGEIGLAGEVRAVGQMELRLREARRLGFTKFLLPASSAAHLQENNLPGQGSLQAVSSVTALAELLFA